VLSLSFTLPGTGKLEDLMGFRMIAHALARSLFVFLLFPVSGNDPDPGYETSAKPREVECR
jgi:hypothetical protein